MRLGLRCVYTSVLLLLLTCVASAQSATSAPQTVEVRLQMNWWTEPASRSPRVALVRLDPLGPNGSSETIRLSETSTAIARLAPGRYQLTTTAPLTYNGQAYGWSIELPLTAPVNYVRLSQENAVRLAPQNGIEPALREATLAQGTAGSKPGGDEAEARAQINALLNRWVASVKSRSLQTQMSCYAPQLTSYLQQGSLSRAQLEARKQKMLTAYTSTHLDLSNIELSIHGSQAVANAIKSWDFSNNEVDSRGRTLLSLGLAKLDGRWLIISEQEYAVPAPSRNAPPRLAASTSAGAR